jgi:hypothetical protein
MGQSFVVIRASYFFQRLVRLAMTLLMKKQPRQDRRFHRDIEPDHPFQEDKFGLNLGQTAIDPEKR